jgi:hypothetical protein
MMVVLSKYITAKYISTAITSVTFDAVKEVSRFDHMGHY